MKNTTNRPTNLLLQQLETKRQRGGRRRGRGERSKSRRAHTAALESI